MDKQLSFSLTCIDTNEKLWLEEIEIMRLITMTSRNNKQIFRKLRPFYKNCKNENCNNNGIFH